MKEKKKKNEWEEKQTIYMCFVAILCVRYIRKCIAITWQRENSHSGRAKREEEDAEEQQNKLTDASLNK